MADPTTPPTEASLLDWVAEVVRAAVDRWEPHPASGRSRLIWLVEAGGQRFLLRRETGLGPFAGTEFTLGREAGVVGALAMTGLPVPVVHGVTEDGSSVVMDLLPGTADLELDHPEGRQVLTRYCAELARLHRLDPGRTPLPLPASPAEHALLDLAAHHRSYRLCAPIPVADRVFDHLIAHAPASATRTSVLHGDAGPGNFLHHQHRVTGLIDWEMTHVGDPMDDLAWLWFRIAILRSGGGDPAVGLATAFDAYREASGTDIDAGLVDYYCLLVLARCLVATLTRARNHPAHSTEPVERMSRLVTLALGNHARTGRVTGSGPFPRLPGGHPALGS